MQTQSTWSTRSATAVASGAVTTEFRNVNGTLFFSANNKLWRSDGTRKGTRMVRDKRGKKVRDPHDLTAVSGKLFFRSFDAAHGYELWKAAP